MTETDDPVGGFVNRLRRLSVEGHEDRGSLADLRSGGAAAPSQLLDRQPLSLSPLPYAIHELHCGPITPVDGIPIMDNSVQNGK